MFSYEVEANFTGVFSWFLQVLFLTLILLPILLTYVVATEG